MAIRIEVVIVGGGWGVRSVLFILYSSAFPYTPPHLITEFYTIDAADRSKTSKPTLWGGGRDLEEEDMVKNNNALYPVPGRECGRKGGCGNSGKKGGINKGIWSHISLGEGAGVGKDEPIPAKQIEQEGERENGICALVGGTIWSNTIQNKKKQATPPPRYGFPLNPFTTDDNSCTRRGREKGLRLSLPRGYRTHISTYLYTRER